MKHALEKAINYFLLLDSHSENRMRVLENKKAVIELSGLPVSFYLHFSRGKVHFLSDAKAPDVMIRGTPLSLMHVAFAQKDRQKFFAEEVELKGDAEVGQKLIQLFDELDIDWEDYFSQYIGDVPAHQLSRFARRVNHFVRDVKDSFSQNVNEYLHEEKEFFPTREMLQDFFHEIDQARMDTDRLEIRLEKLRNI